VKRHPVLGLLGGLCAGLGLALLAVLYGWMAAGTRSPLLTVGGFAVVGLVWGWRGPVRVRARLQGDTTPEYNERIQQALSDNEAAIDEARRPRQLRPEDLPDIQPASGDDDTDWHGRGTPP
jgi:hypothetical protein